MNIFKYLLFLLIPIVAVADLPTRVSNGMIVGPYIYPKVANQDLGSSTMRWDLWVNELNGTTFSAATIPAGGTTGEYLRGPNEWATLDTAAVPENGNLYFTNTRARGVLSGVAPVDYDSGTGAFSMEPGSSTANGYLSTSVYNAFDAKEPGITAGTSLQYWRGDKTFQTLNTAAVPESGSLYHTEARARESISATAPALYDDTTGVISIAPGSSTAAGYVTTGAQGVAGEKTFENALGVKELGSSPANPDAGYQKLYAKSDGKVYRLESDGTETELGAGAGGGGGGGGINFIALDSSFAPTLQNNSDLETTVGSWAAFADAAASEPADLTGGSPTVTCARNTSSPLNNAGDLVITKDAANRQGEGCAAPFYVPPGYRGKTNVISFPFKIDSGSLVSGDIQVWIYDVTNSQKIKPYNLDIVGPQGTVIAKFDVPTTMAQGRLGVYFASTSSTAITARIDDIFAGFKEAVYGLNGSDTFVYTPTLNSTSNVAFNQATYWIIGDRVYITGTIRWSGVGSGNLTVGLPSGMTMDAAKMNRDASAGTAPSDGFYGMWIDAGNALFDLYPRGDSGNTAFSFLNSAGSGFSQGSTANGDQIQYAVNFPIVNLSSNVSRAESSTYWISNYLASGTRVTATPTKLGEYRSYLRNAGAKTFTETNGTPSTSPSATNGMVIYNQAYGSAGSSGQPNRYEIFIGKNKNYSLQAYQSTGRTGYVSTDVTFFGNGLAITRIAGLNQSYDLATGILTISSAVDASATDNGGVGQDSAYAILNSAYFDIKVSENALAVGMQNPRSEVWLYGGNGWGATNTKIRRFVTTAKNVGTAVLYSESAALGASFQILENGLYTITYGDYLGSGGHTYGASVNSSELTTSVGSIVDTTRLFYVRNLTGDTVIPGSVTIALSAGDIVRPHTDGSQTSGAAAVNCYFRITKVSN